MGCFYPLIITLYCHFSTVVVTDDIEVTVTNGPQPVDSSGLDTVGLSVGVLVVCVVFLVCIIVAAVFIAILVVRRKKGNTGTLLPTDQTRLVACICATCKLFILL